MYSTGTPTEVGVYACRVPDPEMGDEWPKDIFLMWHQDKWWYLSSDSQFRFEVYCFLGPLPRVKSANDERLTRV